MSKIPFNWGNLGDRNVEDIAVINIEENSSFPIYFIFLDGSSQMIESHSKRFHDEILKFTLSLNFLIKEPQDWPSIYYNSSLIERCYLEKFNFNVEPKVVVKWKMPTESGRLHNNIFSKEYFNIMLKKLSESDKMRLRIMMEL